MTDDSVVELRNRLLRESGMSVPPRSPLGESKTAWTVEAAYHAGYLAGLAVVEVDNPTRERLENEVAEWWGRVVAEVGVGSN